MLIAGRMDVYKYYKDVLYKLPRGLGCMTKWQSDSLVTSICSIDDSIGSKQ